MTALDTAALRKVAEAATPGPWHSGVYGSLQEAVFLSDFARFIDVPRRADAAHIATFDPPTVTALLDRVEAAEAAVARVEALADEYDISMSPRLIDASVIVADLRAALDGAP